MPPDVTIPEPFNASTIAEVLGEQDADPRRLIRNVLSVFGRFTTWRLLQKTLDVEAHGGLLVTDGSRRRTPGGTFFALARQWCQSADEQQRIFGTASLRMRNGHVRALAKAPQAPAHPVQTVAEALTGLPHLHGDECRMKTTLIGRPDQIVTRDGYVLFKLTGALAPSLPKGLPKAPPTPLSWIVMVAQKQWGKVAESLARDPQARAIIEGYPCTEGKALRALGDASHHDG
jgi:hypothetical protein